MLIKIKDTMYNRGGEGLKNGQNLPTDGSKKLLMGVKNLKNLKTHLDGPIGKNGKY